jgi:hypothetical protein
MAMKSRLNRFLALFFVDGKTFDQSPGTAEGDGPTERFGLNSLGNLSLNLRDGVGLGVGLAVALGCVFLRVGLASGDTPGDSVVTGEVGVSAGEAVASTPLCWRLFFGGEGESAGSRAGTAT